MVAFKNGEQGHRADSTTAITTGNRKEDNKLRLEDRAAHDWYRFVLSFPPHLVRHYAKKFGLVSSDCVLDPFCGTGTTLVECKKLNLTSIGIEPNPVACFASRVKVDWNINADGLLAHAREIAQITHERLKRDGIDEMGGLSLFSQQRIAGTTLRTLPAETWKFLLKDSISPLPLHKTLVLLEVLAEEADDRFYGHERLALAKAIVFGISNLQFGPEVGIGVPKVDAPVISLWLRGVEAMAGDLRKLAERPQSKATVHLADARHLAHVLDPNSVDAVITSPPYPNEKDYTRTTRLESVLLGFIQSKTDLRSLKQTLVRSNTRGVYKSDQDDLLVAGHGEIQRIAKVIEQRRLDMGKTSGFERLYARVTKLYFGGMTRHLADLRAILRPGAQLAYVVGDQASYLRVMIRTGQLLAGIAESLGYEVAGLDLFRTRLSTATREQLREEVVLLRWPGAKT
ncbi:MAG TPA: DNA methyltransferase [Candidatus Saccharimonadales bacterium]|nr:DNA methyltransferase [Candidatus Saccharimonadales bacterium]